MKKIYKATNPRHFLFGDPLYFGQYRGAHLQKLVVDYKPPRRYKVWLVLEEGEDEQGFLHRVMTVYFAPDATMGTYVSGVHFADQECDERKIGVDSARYLIEVDGRREEVHTDGDGYWGSIVTLSRGKTVDAVIITVELPEHGILDPEKWARQLFENMEPVGEKTKKKTEPLR